MEEGEGAATGGGGGELLVLLVGALGSEFILEEQRLGMVVFGYK